MLFASKYCRIFYIVYDGFADLFKIYAKVFFSRFTDRRKNVEKLILQSVAR